MMPLRAKHLTAAYRTAPIEMMVGRDPELDGAHDQHEAQIAKTADEVIQMGDVDMLTAVDGDLTHDLLNAVADMDWSAVMKMAFQVRKARTNEAKRILEARS